MGAFSASCDLCRDVDARFSQCIVAVSTLFLNAAKYQISMTEKL